MNIPAELPHSVRARFASAFNSLSRPSAEELRQAILESSLTLQDVAGCLSTPGENPYGRKLIFFSPGVEALVMNWARNQSCLPHNHGRSIGWVKVLKGNVEHIVFEKEDDGLRAKCSTREPEGSLIFAPLGIVHSMGNASQSEDLVTLHFYSPPITGMEVYDLEKRMGCVVADDCGAWWPNEEQLVSLKPLTSAIEV